jgi:hypothetical protein
MERVYKLAVSIEPDEVFDENFDERLGDALAIALDAEFLTPYPNADIAAMLEPMDEPVQGNK